MTDSATSISEANGAAGQALYRRFRAQTFSQIVGQDAVVQTLRNAVRLDRVGHGFLFVGPRGTGKTSMARILAKAVNCTDLHDGEPCDACPSCSAIREGRALDVVELDAASNNKVDDMRELVPRVYTGAADLARKVFIIDEVQRIKEGWDVLLKTLEEPPPGVLFIFCTTDPSQIRPAVVSRLQRFTFRPLAVPEIEGKLQRILEAEGRKVDAEAIALVAQLAGGGMRDAESMLDQVLVSADDPITAASIRDLLGLADGDMVERFIRALVEGDVLAGMEVLDGLEAEGRDLIAFSEQLVTQLRTDLVQRLSQRSAADRAAARPLARAARRLTGIDASRSGLGGYRWQLELCLLSAADGERRAATTASGAAATSSTLSGSPAHPAPEPKPAPTTATEPQPAAAPAPQPMAALEPQPMAAPEPQTAAAPEPQTAAAPEPQTAAAPEPQTAAAPEPQTAAAPEPATARASASEPEASPAPASSTTSTVRAEPAPASAPPAAPKPVPPQPAETQPSDARAADELTQIRAAWPAIVAAIAGNPANRPLVTACRPIELRDGALVLGFPEDQAFMRDIAERKRRVLEEGIAAVVGRHVAVRCVVANLEFVEPVQSGEGDLVSRAQQIFEGELAGIDDID